MLIPKAHKVAVYSKLFNGKSCVLPDEQALSVSCFHKCTEAAVVERGHDQLL